MESLSADRFFFPWWRESDFGGNWLTIVKDDNSFLALLPETLNLHMLQFYTIFKGECVGLFRFHKPFMFGLLLPLVLHKPEKCLHPLLFFLFGFDCLYMPDIGIFSDGLDDDTQPGTSFFL